MGHEPLRTFVAVARCGSLSAAARELFISQPAVTQQIQKLEARLQTRLFIRHERGVELTTAGQLFLDYAQRIIELEDLASEALAAHRQSLSGTLRLGATFTLGEYVLPPIIGRFKAANPDVEIVLEVENTAKVVEHVVTGHFSCGAVEGPVHNALVRSERLADDEMAVVCGSSHPCAGRHTLTLDELVLETWILREAGSGTQTVFEEALLAAGRDPAGLRVLMRLGSTQSVKGMVMEGLGLTVLSPWAIRAELAAGTLHRLVVPELDLHRAFSLVFPRGGRLPLVTRRFVRFCRDSLSQ